LLPVAPEIQCCVDKHIEQGRNFHGSHEGKKIVARRATDSRRRLSPHNLAISYFPSGFGRHEWFWVGHGFSRAAQVIIRLGL
jgi:hypothetical protein